MSVGLKTAVAATAMAGTTAMVMARDKQCFQAAMATAVLPVVATVMVEVTVMALLAARRAAAAAAAAVAAAVGKLPHTIHPL